MNNRRSRRERQNNVIRAAAGISLIVVGVGLAILLLSLPNNTNAVNAEDGAVMPAAVHAAAPELALTDISGARGSLADYRGKVVLVNNWATWCPPCKAEMPTLESYYEDHVQQGFVVIAIEAGESQQDVQPFVQAFGLQFPIWLDPQKAALAVFRNENLPNSYVLDRGGTIRYAWTGETSRSMLEKFVTPLLGQG
ncbi:MAG TPA: TlpA disulfide reductase family protein [Anaerolineales bacterium]